MMEVHDKDDNLMVTIILVCCIVVISCILFFIGQFFKQVSSEPVIGNLLIYKIIT